MKLIYRILVLFTVTMLSLCAQDKTAGVQSENKSLVIQGNKITTMIYNTSDISRPGVMPNQLDLVWNGLGYGYEFGPLVAAKVPKGSSAIDSVKIVDDGLYFTADGDFSPDGMTKWGWLPKAGYSAPGQPEIASWGARLKVGNDLRQRPPSWPESWYNSTLGQYVYPSYLGGNSTVPDEEVLFAVDDWTNAEYEYYPFPGDSTRRGLGVNLEVRTLQYSNPLAEDIIFLVYTVENASPKTLGNMYFGMFGDPHIGGANNYADDAASFIPARQGMLFKNGVDLATINGVLTTPRSRNLVFAWDPDNKSDIATIAPGYFGYKFLESPSNSGDGIDNDDDGLVDESPFNDKGTYIDGITVPLTTGIADPAKYKAMYGSPKPRWSGDENGNWDAARDDVGIDGIAGTGDFGEGNGVPDQSIAADGTWLGSEPDFGFRDVNESDQIGLKSFWALIFGGDNRPKNDVLMYDKLSSPIDAAGIDLLTLPGGTAPVGDNLFLYGCGPFTLKQGNRQRFSIALMMGQTLSELLLNSETSQRVLEANYRFAQPPPKPHVTAVAGDKRVTLYWDTAAETGVDPLINLNDFEGYKIYRSQDPTFSDVFTITDGYGVPFIGKALYDDKAKRSAQWHLPWTDSLKAVYTGGFHPVEYAGRFVKYYMGDPADQSGLRHQYVDSTVANGTTYYYAVVAFDHGAVSGTIQLPPTETQALITRNQATQALVFDVNTLAATPHVGDAGDHSGDYMGKTIAASHTRGAGTGGIRFEILNARALQNNTYSVSFTRVKNGADTVLAYNVLCETPVTESIVGRDQSYVGLKKKNILVSSVKVRDAANTVVDPLSIVVDSTEGRIKGAAAGVLKNDAAYTVTYTYYPVAKSASTAGRDDNPVFDGVRPFVTDEALRLDSTRSGFAGAAPYAVLAVTDKASAGLHRAAPIDVKITFTKSLGDTTALGAYTTPVDSLKPVSGSLYVKVPFVIENATDQTPLTVLVKDSGMKGRWDVGDEIVVVTPPPYTVTPSNTMMGILFRRSSTEAGAMAPVIPAGTVYVARTQKPFTVHDGYTVTTNIVTAIEEHQERVPMHYVLSQNYPNPFNPATTIAYALPHTGHVKLAVYNVLGQEVVVLVDGIRSAGAYTVAFEGGGLASGMYLYRLDAGAFTAVKKMMLIK